MRICKTTLSINKQLFVINLVHNKTIHVSSTAGTYYKQAFYVPLSKRNLKQNGKEVYMPLTTTMAKKYESWWNDSVKVSNVGLHFEAINFHIANNPGFRFHCMQSLWFFLFHADRGSYLDLHSDWAEGAAFMIDNHFLWQNQSAEINQKHGRKNSH